MPDPEPAVDPATGRGIVVASHLANALLAAAVLPAAFGVGSFEAVSIAASLLSFLVALVVWGWAFARAAMRTTRGDDVAVASLFLVQGSAAGTPRRSLYGALAVCLTITVVAAGSDPFVVLAPMLPLGLVGLWGARHGVYPARREAPRRTPGIRTGVDPDEPEGSA